MMKTSPKLMAGNVGDLTISVKLEPLFWKIGTSDPDEKEKRRAGTRPPKRGICRRCGQDKPVNRLMLCYACWVITEIEQREAGRGRVWHAGMKHPEWCRCHLPGHNCGGMSMDS